MVKFMFPKKATKIDEIFTIDLTLFSKCQIDGEDFDNFCGLLRKHELYIVHVDVVLYVSNADAKYSLANLLQTIGFAKEIAEK